MTIYTILSTTDKNIEWLVEVTMHCTSAVIVISRNTAISESWLNTPSSLTLYNTVVLVHPLTEVNLYVIERDVVLRQIWVVSAIDCNNLLATTTFL